MTTVKISPEVQLQEMQAHVAHLQNRSLILAERLKQAMAIGSDFSKELQEKTAILAERDARIAELEAAAEHDNEEKEPD